jgi:hypothetical protein
VSRRVTLPGADELFRATSGSVRSDSELRVETDEPTGPERDEAASVTPLRTRPSAARVSGSRRPSGREKHDEKITVYVSPTELVDLEHARLALRADHGLAVDRGRIVREALAVVIADLEAKGADSILVRRLRDL